MPIASYDCDDKNWIENWRRDGQDLHQNTLEKNQLNEFIRYGRFLILLVAAASMLTGCGGKEAVAPVDVEKQAFEDLRLEVREAIDDPVRESEALMIVDALSSDLTTLRESISQRNRRVRQLNANYDTPRADFESLFDQIYREIRANQQRVTKSHRALLAATTPEEWERISKSRTKAMYASIKTIQTD